MGVFVSMSIKTWLSQTIQTQISIKSNSKQFESNRTINQYGSWYFEAQVIII
jgi:hypothetical protein